MATSVDRTLAEQLDQFLQHNAAQANAYQQVARAVGRERARRDVQAAMVRPPARTRRVGFVARIARHMERLRQRQSVLTQVPRTGDMDGIIIDIIVVNASSTSSDLEKEAEHGNRSDDPAGIPFDSTYTGRI